MAAAAYISARKSLAAQLFEFPNVHVVVGLLGVSAFDFPSLTCVLEASYLSVDAVDIATTNIERPQSSFATITFRMLPRQLCVMNSNAPYSQTITVPNEGDSFERGVGVLRDMVDMIELRHCTAHRVASQHNERRVSTIPETMRWGHTSDHNGESAGTGQSAGLASPPPDSVTAIGTRPQWTMALQDDAHSTNRHPSISISRVALSMQTNDLGGGWSMADMAPSRNMSLMIDPFSSCGDHTPSMSMGDNTPQYHDLGPVAPSMLASPDSGAIFSSHHSGQTPPLVPQARSPLSPPAATSSDDVVPPNHQLASTCAPPQSRVLLDYLHSRMERDAKALQKAIEAMRSSAEPNEGPSCEVLAEGPTTTPTRSPITLDSGRGCEMPVDPVECSDTVTAIVPVVPEMNAVAASDDDELAQLIDTAVASRTAFWRTREGQSLLLLIATSTSKITSVALLRCQQGPEHYTYDQKHLSICLCDTTSLDPFLNALAHNFTIETLQCTQLITVSDAMIERLVDTEIEKAESSVMAALVFTQCMNMTDQSAAAILRWLHFIKEESGAKNKGALRHVVLRGPESPWSRVMYDAVLMECVDAANCFAASGIIVE